MKFEEILFSLILSTGLIWLFDIIFLKKKRQQSLNEPIIVEYAKSFFYIFLLVLLLRSFLFEPFRIPTGSMKPTLLEGDFILVNKFCYGLRLPILSLKMFNISKPRIGDVIVFKHSSNRVLIKRVIGIPGDHIQYINDILYINGKEIKQIYSNNTFDVDVNGFITPVKLSKEVLYKDTIHNIYLRLNKSIDYGYKFTDVIVPENNYFVLGDNRNNSKDSRFWGFVKEQDLLGRAFATWMSWDGHNNDIRWERICRKIN